MDEGVDDIEDVVSTTRSRTQSIGHLRKFVFSRHPYSTIQCYVVCPDSSSLLSGTWTDPDSTSQNYNLLLSTPYLLSLLSIHSFPLLSFLFAYPIPQFSRYFSLHPCFSFLSLTLCHFTPPFFAPRTTLYTSCWPDRASSYFLTKTFLELPLGLVQTFVQFIICYFMINLQVVFLLFIKITTIHSPPLSQCTVVYSIL